MNIEQLSQTFSAPSEGIHCIQMQCSRNFIEEVFEFTHVVETEDALKRLMEHYTPISLISQSHMTADGKISYPAAVLMKWKPGMFLQEGEWFNTSFEVIGGSTIKLLIEKIKEKLESGNHQEAQEPEHLGH
ncbi:hypothetical protein [Erwinia phage vB_Ea277G]|nr:hypothetical protein [Erwinia phage vB_Ea277G]